MKAALLNVVGCVLLPVTLLAQDSDYQLDLSSSGGVTGATAVIAVTLTSSAEAIAGFQFDVCDDDLIDTGFSEIEFGAALDDRALATYALDFAADAWSVSAVLASGSELPAGDAHEILVATYDLLEVGASELGFCGTLVEAGVTTALGEDIEPETSGGTLSIEPSPMFLRGDANGDGRVEALLDAAYLLAWAFTAGGEPPCRDAADMDNNGVNSALLDALFLLVWAFSGGADPVAPGTETCGEDPGAVGPGCETEPDPCPGERPSIEPDASLTLRFGATPAAVAVGADVVFPVLLEVEGDPVHGFQLGVCHDAGLDLADAGAGLYPVALGSDVPGTTFNSIQLLGDGWTAATLLSIILGTEIDSGANEIYTAAYTVIAEGFSAVEFCDSLGDPLVPPRVLRDLTLVIPTTESSGGVGIGRLEPGLLLTSPSGPVGGTAPVGVLLTNSGDPLSGWHWGVCDDDLVSLESGSLEEGAALSDLVFDLHVVTTVQDGWTVSALLDGVADSTLEPGVGLEMYRARYSLEETGFATVGFCESLGDPAVTVRWLADTEEIEPDTYDGLITVTLPVQFQFRVEAPVVSYDPDDVSAGIAFTAELSIQEDATRPGFPNDTEGFSMGLAHDGAQLEPTGAAAIGVLAAFDGGAGPEFIAVDLAPGADAGVTVSVVYGASGGTFLEFDGAEPVIAIDYMVLESVLPSFEGNVDGAVTTLEWSNDLGVPVVPNAVVLDGVEVEVGLANVSVYLLPEGVALLFLRGDIDGNGITSALLDGLFVLQWGFLGGPESPCLDAADCDDNGEVSALLDGLYLLTWGFLGGPEPPPPGTARCGPDPTDDNASCRASPAFCSD